MTISPIEEIIEDAKSGKMFILADDENRENEGDLIIPAQYCNADAVNFMAKYGRGLICLAMDSKRVHDLGLNLMSQHNQSRHQTAFTTSIEAREGVTTGISAADRATTIAAAIDPTHSKGGIVSPGHIFPLIARDGGVLVRAGHTEAAVDIAHIAGLQPSGVICEIMNDDGTMSRMDDLVKFGKKHNIKIATIEDLIAYRRKSEKLVKREIETKFNSRYGGTFDMVIYSTTQEYVEHIALIKGEINSDKPVLVRVHALDVLSDVLGDADIAHQKQHTMEMIAKEGGVLLLIRQPNPKSISQRVRTSLNSKYKPADSIRDYGIGAQILRDLGVRKMTLLANAQKPVIGLDAYGLEICGYRNINDNGTVAGHLY